jgi:hypothetical protein
MMLSMTWALLEREGGGLPGGLFLNILLTNTVKQREYEDKNTLFRFIGESKP